MLLVLRQKYAFLFLILTALTLTACGDNEAGERKEFINFLQKQVLSRKSTFVPFPSDKEKSAFGRYASHYQVIVDFTNDMETEMNTFKKYSGETKYKTIQGIRDNWKELDELRTSLKRSLGEALQAQRGKAQSARDALEQPEDLKTVYDQAFDKTINKPTEAVSQLLPVLDSALGTTVTFGRFLDENRDKITISGMMVQPNDPKLNDTVNNYINEMNLRNGELMKAANDFMKYAYGR